MADRPILFSAPMVRALLAGTKMQTRRVVKLPSIIAAEPNGESPAELNGLTTVQWLADHEGGQGFYGWMTDYPEEGSISMRCPYGAPGGRLWVREAWRVGNRYDATPPRDIPPRKMTVLFEAGGSIANQESGDWEPDDWPRRPGPIPEWVGKLRPGMFMPRWASRLTLEVTGVRVERLQQISGEDAAAEGVDPIAAWRTDEPVDRFDMPRFTPVPVMRYAKLWEQINGPGSWDANPWVWVVEFRRL